MSTANFTTMKHFPLYTYPTTHWEMRCDDCGEYWEYDENDTACPFCGSGDVSEVDSGWSRADDFFFCIKPDIDELNRNLRFHEVTVESGYYTGLQLYVKAEHDLEEYEYDEEFCQWDFGMSRSRAHCMFYAERVKINRCLAELAYQHGMDELICVGVFSNGEAVYRRVEDTQRSRIMQAVAPRF